MLPTPDLQSKPQEDLSVVLGRFHVWDAIQKGLPPGVAAEGVLEVSYEEALAARRPHSTPALVPATPPPDVQAPETHAGLAGEVELQPQSQAANAEATEITVVRGALIEAESAIPAAAANLREVKSALKTRRRAAAKPTAMVQAKSKETAIKKAVPSKSILRTAAQQRAGKPALPVSARSQTAAQTKHSVQQTRMPKRGAHRSTQLPDRPAEKKTLSERNHGQERNDLAKPKSAASRQKAASPTFQGALAACLKTTPNNTKDRHSTVKAATSRTSATAAPKGVETRNTGKRAPAMTVRTTQRTSAQRVVAQRKQPAPGSKAVARSARTISLNLRLSHPEHAQMRAGAAAAGVPLAAYIRESTLRACKVREAEKQAFQVQSLQDPSLLADKPAASVATPARAFFPAREPGLLSRMRIFWFGRRNTLTA